MKLKISCFVLCLLIAFPFYSQKKVGIIGGGIAGVAAAHYIQEYDKTAEVILFEKEGQLGGNALTVDVTTAEGKTVQVDVGPQYFTKGPWDDYIQFLDETLEWKNVKYESMDASLVIQRTNEQNPFVATPVNGKFRGEKLKNLLRLRKFMTAAYDVFVNPSPWKEKSIAEWGSTLDFEESYKIEVIYPLLAASLGTSISEIKTTATVEIVSLFAFRKPKGSNQFEIMTEGMGGLIQQIGEKLKANGVQIALNSPVEKVEQKGEQYLISYRENGQLKTQLVDFVVMAVHADIASRLTKDESAFTSMSHLLSQFPYFEAHIVIHQDDRFIQKEKPAFLNIFTDESNELIFSTMNLSMISERLNGVYKSWLPNDVTAEMKAKNLLLHETTFYHPMITPAFVANLSLLKEEQNRWKNISIIGGWTEGLETQNSAVLSAKRALEKYKLLKP